MHIANPIYDVVVRFMIEDTEVAKSFFSAIIKEEIVELDIVSMKYTLRSLTERPRQKDKFLTVCRFDFSAKISLPDGSFKTVMIELQKAKYPSDIMRFRRYVELHSTNPGNTCGNEDDKKACQIYSIFILNNNIGIPEIPIIRMNHTVIDDITGEKLEVTDNEFIQSLHHRSWIIQIDQIKQRRRNDVEKLLNIFDQKNCSRYDHYIMNVDENSFPEIYHPIIHRLRMAHEDEYVQNEMETEEFLFQDLQNHERQIAQLDKEIEEKEKQLKN